MKRFLTLFLATLMGFGIAVSDAEAKRLGGGKSIGKQRESISQQATPKQPAQAPAPAPAQAAGGGKWLGPLAGLAAGGLLAALFLGGAFEGIQFLDVLMLALLIGAAFFIFRMLRRPAESAQRPMQYSGLSGAGQVPSQFESGAGGGVAARPAANIPAGFAVEPFVRSAKTSFIRLQAANDARDLDDIRGYTTPEMFAEIKMQIEERGNEPQKTDVAALNAELLEVVTEGDWAIASVRFSGMIRENTTAPESFDEIWHVQKDLRDPKAVWLIAGIQQVQ